MTKKQGDFVREFARNGGKRSDAAVAAGYVEATARIEAYRLLQKPAVRDALRQETEGLLQSGVPLAASTLEHLCRDSESDAIRLAAAKELLDRGGLMLVKKTETTVRVEDSRTDAELIEHARQLAARLGMATVIDGDLLIRPSGLSENRPRPPKVQLEGSISRVRVPAAKNSEASEFPNELFS